ncbi:hypothetical protein [Pleionea sp. CnH1-48]|uniref:hypothetical protein n=1 Tax=Pleionea sp. CnH1-48 TaxID=2954494 RepID=UPI0020982968|nr:hypothetical protein [Pleionea sp. CnH1-48]MCO7225244.1 hypothetical protein [Pleionea sp. CnH1-48]
MASELPQEIATIYGGLHKIGINCYAVADGQNHQDVLEGCQSVIVFASGGGALWQSFYNHLSLHRNFLKQHEHPLDQFIKNTLSQVDIPSPSRVWRRCSMTDKDFVDFRMLAGVAALGWKSPTGLLIHPEFGLWIGLRLACFTKEKIAPSTLNEPAPCKKCKQECMSACPASAISHNGWNYKVCFDYHKSSTDCHQGCNARVACPVGQAHEYPKLAQYYHHNKVMGRKQLAKQLEANESGTVADCDVMPWQKD